MKHLPPLSSASFGSGRANRRTTRLERGLFVSLFAAVVVLAILALGVSSGSLLHDESCAGSAKSISCQAPSAVELQD